MPNLIRYKRGHHPPPMLSYPVLRNAGTRLSLRERDIVLNEDRISIVLSKLSDTYR